MHSVARSERMPIRTSVLVRNRELAVEDAIHPQLLKRVEHFGELRKPSNFTSQVHPGDVNAIGAVPSSINA